MSGVKRASCANTGPLAVKSAGFPHARYVFSMQNSHSMSVVCFGYAAIKTMQISCTNVMSLKTIYILHCMNKPSD